MKAKRTPVNVEVIMQNLPSPPTDCSYSVEKVSELVHKVWIHHNRTFDYTTDPVKCIYCYVKRDEVHPAKNKDKMRIKSYCHISELSQCDPYSVINDTHDSPSLLHL